MDKQIFKTLLIDLYNIYNPANIEYVDDLVEKYNRHEFSAVQNIFFKYNRKTASYYDPKIGTDEHILMLIKEYNSGNRSLEGVDFKAQKQAQEKENSIIEQKKIEEDKEKASKNIEHIKQSVKTEMFEKFKTIENSFEEKEASIKKSLDKLYKDFEKKIESLKESNDDVVIRIFSKHSSSELDLPNKKQIAALGIGSRLIIKDKDGKILGMEIVDVIYDAVSNMDDKPLIEIFLEKS